MFKKKTPEADAVESSPEVVRDERLAVAMMADPVGTVVATLTIRLNAMLSELLDMQHARAKAGGGLSTPWQNAQAHLQAAIDCIATQAEVDARRAK